MILDTALIDIIGVKQFFTLYRKVVIAECKQAGLSQSQTLAKLNHDLEAQGQKPVTLSLIKAYW